MNVVITGASSGLGAALARRYAAPGVTLGLVARNPERLAAVVEACTALGAEVVTGAFDVADGATTAAWIADFEGRAAIDTVIANAGVSAGPPPAEGATEGFDSVARQVQTNLLGVMATIEAVLPAMIARGRGRVGIVSSIAGLRGLPYSPGYSASKAGSRAYGEALRALVRPHGVTVSVICPGFFASPMTDRWKGATPGLRTADRVAADVHRCVEAGRSRESWPWWLVLGMRAADLGPPSITDAILRGFRFHIEGPAA